MRDLIKDKKKQIQAYHDTIKYTKEQLQRYEEQLALLQGDVTHDCVQVEQSRKYSGVMSPIVIYAFALDSEQDWRIKQCELCTNFLRVTGHSDDRKVEIVPKDQLPDNLRKYV